MEVSRDRIDSMLMRRGKLADRIDALERLIAGTGEPISAVLGDDEEAYDAEARKFAHDVAKAYSAYLGYLGRANWNAAYEDELTWGEAHDYDNVWLFGRAEIAEKGDPMRLDEKQLQLVGHHIRYGVPLRAPRSVTAQGGPG